jgi:hypothetical protein
MITITKAIDAGRGQLSACAPAIDEGPPHLHPYRQGDKDIGAAI